MNTLLLTSLTNIWKTLVDQGINAHTNQEERILIRFFNKVSVIGVFTALLFCLVTWHEADFIGLAFTLICMCLVTGSILLNHYQQHLFSRIYGTIFLTVTMTAIISLYGRDVGGAFTYLMLAMVLLIFLKSSKVQFILFAFIFCNYIISEINLFVWGPILEDKLSPLAYYILFVCNFACMFFIAKTFLKERTSFERKTEKLIEKIQQKNQALERTNEELERFAYIASHDLKTPLRNIISFLNLMERKFHTASEKELKEYLHFASKGARQMYHIVEDVLEYSKIGSANLQNQIDLNTVLQRVQTNLATPLKNRSALLRIDPLPKIYANEQQMISLFQNLIENALKYNESSQPVILIFHQPKKTSDLIMVVDNGIGIDKEFQPRIFDMFRRLHNSEEYDGSGIGLAICKKIVEQSQGKIWVESEGEGGTKFFIEFQKTKIKTNGKEMTQRQAMYAR